MDRGAWRARVCGGVTKSWTRLSNYHIISPKATAQAETQVGIQTHVFRSFIHLAFSILCFYKIKITGAFETD